MTEQEKTQEERRAFLARAGKIAATAPAAALLLAASSRSNQAQATSHFRQDPNGEP